MAVAWEPWDSGSVLSLAQWIQRCRGLVLSCSSDLLPSPGALYAMGRQKKKLLSSVIELVPPIINQFIEKQNLATIWVVLLIGLNTTDVKNILTYRIDQRLCRKLNFLKEVWTMVDNDLSM